MADPKETVYDAEPHTRAKHQILCEYLKRWLPILARQSELMSRNNRLLYIDGFSGAGEYRENIPGSPVVAFETALSSSQGFSIPIQIKLIELRHDRVEHLRGIVTRLRARLSSASKIILDDPIEGDCEEAINKIIAEHTVKNGKLGPALLFLDQFGYSSFSINLIGRILCHDVCEVFSYLNWNLLHPFMTDETKHARIAKAFGGDEWKNVIGLSGKEKEDRFCEIYLKALRERGNAKYAFPFTMRDQNDRVIYWLFFCSNNIRGLEEMKKAMWTVDGSGGFEFSDKHATQVGGLFKYEVSDLARDLLVALDGRAMTVEEVKEYVLVNTPAYVFKSALIKLEKDGCLKPIDPPRGRRRGSFSEENMRVLFARQSAPPLRSLFDPQES